MKNVAMEMMYVCVSQWPTFDVKGTHIQCHPDVNN